MELNEGQKKAVQEAIKRINNHEICTCIAGPAGLRFLLQLEKCV